MSTVRRDLANLIRQGGYDPEDDYSYSLRYGDDQASLSRVVADVIVAGTGLSGDAEDRARATIAAVGSFDLTYRVMAVDNDTRRAVVAFEATNIWGLESLSRQPAGSGAGDSLLSGRTSGSMQNVRQFWYWVEEIRF